MIDGSPEAHDRFPSEPARPEARAEARSAAEPATVAERDSLLQALAALLAPSGGRRAGPSDAPGVDLVVRASGSTVDALVRDLATTVGGLDHPVHVVRVTPLDAASLEMTLAARPRRAWHLLRVKVAGPASPAAAAARRRGDGLVVAVYGVDGSGKSTVVASLCDALAPLFPRIDRWHLFARQIEGDVRRVVTDPHGHPPRSRAMGAAKVGWYWLIAWLVRTPQVRRARAEGRLVVLDRDVRDPWLDPRRYRLRRAGTPLPVWPRPDLALVLEADVSTILSRSDELPEEAVAELLVRYRAFAASAPWAVTVDVRVAPADVASAAIGAVLARMEATTLAVWGAHDGAGAR